MNYRGLLLFLMVFCGFYLHAEAAPMFSSSAPISVFSATITQGTTRPTAIVTHDFNADSFADIAVSDSANNAVFVFLNDKLGGFSAPTTSYGAGGITPVNLVGGFLNNDVYSDLLIVNQGNNKVSRFFGNSTGISLSGSMIAQASPTDLVMGDWNKDGYTDIAAMNSGAQTVSVWLATSIAATTFSTVKNFTVGLTPVAMAASDVNNDTYSDLLVLDASGLLVSVLLNNGTGNFLTKVDYPALTIAQRAADLSAIPNALAVGDLNADGTLDAVIGYTNSQTLSVLLGNGIGGFGVPVLTSTLGVSTQGIKLVDIDGDTNIDIVSVNQSGLSILLGNGTGSFSVPSLNFAAGTSPSGLTLSDVNKNGNIDAIVSNQLSADLYVFSNQTITDVTPPNGIVIIKTTVDVSAALASTAAIDLYTTIDVYAGMIVDGYSILIQDGYANGSNIPVSVGCNDADTGCQQVQYAIDGGAWTRWGTLTGYLINIQLPTTQGLHTVDFRFADGSGNISATVSDSIIIDSTPPTGTVSIAGGALYTNKINELIDFSCTDTGGSGCGKLVGGTYDGYSFDSYGNIASASIALSGGDGTKTITVIAQDRAGNNSPLLSDSIILDTIPPAIPMILTPIAGFGHVATPVISGTAEADSYVEVKNGFAVLATVTTSATGNWSYTPPSPLTTLINQFVVTAKDRAGNISSPSATTTYIVDTTPPVLTLQGASVVNLLAGQVFNDPYATVRDNLSVGLQVTRTGILDVYTAGIYTLSYSAIDAAGNAATPVTRTVIVADSTPPVITLIGTNPLTIAQGTTFVDPGTTVTDNVDAGLLAVVTGNVNSAALGSYTLTYNATDLAGNKATAIVRTVVVADQTAPVITLNGSNQVAVNLGAVFVDPGAVVVDNVDTGLVATVVGTVNTAVAGAYTLTYSAVDQAGNNAIAVTRTVSIGDGLPPVIRLLGSNPLLWALSVPFADPGSAVTDNVSTGLTATVTGTVNSAALGNYVLTYTARDIAGNSTIVTRTVKVIDLTPPVITLLGGSPYSVAQGSVFVEPGSSVSDNVDVGLTAVVTGTVNTAVAGSYTLTYAAVDAAGNTTTLTRIVQVTDTVAPVITLLGANPYTVAQGGLFVDQGATVSDNVDQGLKVTVTGSVNPLLVGNYTLTYTATDLAGNAAIPIIRTVSVTDQTPPVVTLLGAATNTIALGGVFVDAGTSITDNVDVGLLAVITGAVNTAAVGSYILNYTATDAAGNTAVVTRTVDVTDQIAPVITLLGVNPYTLDIGYSYVDVGVTIVDNWDIGLQATMTGTVNTTKLGNYTLIYNVTDAAGNAAASINRIVSVVDRQPPLIVLNGVSVLTIPVATTFVDAGSVVSDNVGMGLQAVVSGTVNTAVIGQYVLNYNAADASGNVALTVSRTVNVTDQQAPQITLNGNATMVVAQGSTFVDLGSVVTDNVDTGLIATVTGAVNTALVGNYTLQYQVTDKAGNSAAIVTRTVTVSDQTAPVVTLNGAATMTVAYDVALPFVDLGATATDNVDPAVAVTVKGFVNRASVGTYVLNYEARDSAGNATVVTRTVHIVDQQAPVITLLGAAVVSVNAGNNFVDAGAIAVDNVDPALTVTTTGTLNTAVVGQYTINYHAVDTAGNAAIVVSRTVNVIDATPPVIQLQGASLISLLQGSTFTDAGTIVTDNVDIGLQATVTGTVNTAVAGTYVLQYNAVDAAGNIALTVQRTVQITTQTPPIIVLLGSNPYTLAVGSVWSDPGVNATDYLNAPLQAVVTGSVNTAVPARYDLSYNGVDALGNPATTVTRTVIIVDSIKPVLTLIGAAAQTIAQGSYYIDFGATVSDNVDVGLMPVVTGKVDTTKVGVYVLNYNATDSAGNIAVSVTRTVTVTDQSKPRITLLAQNPYVVAQGSLWLDPGAVVTDNVDQGLKAVVTGVVNTAVVGTYLLTYQATDAYGNAATPLTRTVQVTDQTPPVLSPPAAITVTAVDAYGVAASNAAIATFLTAATATDNVAVVGTITHNAPTVLAIGVHQITFTAQDQAGNTGRAVSTITVNAAPVVTLGNTTLRINDVYAAIGASLHSQLLIEPYAGLPIYAFTADIRFDGTRLTAATITPTLPVSWQCNQTLSVLSQAGNRDIHLACSTTLAADALTTPFNISLPFTVGTAVTIPSIIPLILSNTSYVADVLASPLPTVLQNGSVIVDATPLVYNLLSGWNLIAFPVDLGATGMADFLAAAPDVKEIWQYNKGSWSSYIIGLPAFLNSLTTLQPIQGYWVRVATGVNPQISISGTPVTGTTALQAGNWNMIGVAQPISTISNYTSQSGAAEVWQYNNGTWCSYNTALPVFLNCLTGMQTQLGYYVR